jgi:N-acetyl-gamma-glutamyl-phosphate reductase common form
VWVYGLPELGVERVRGATRVANPGCFATALALALLPMRGALPEVVHATGLTGSTGSGATPAEGTHHPMRDENLRPYKVLGHQHVPEVVQALGGGFAIDFVPMSAPLRRGILVSVPLPGATAARYREVYAGNPLVRVLDAPPDLLGVLGSPRADIAVVEKSGRAVVFCAIDNLCRGAGSQAVANLNLAMGWAYDRGLRAIPPVP